MPFNVVHKYENILHFLNRQKIDKITVKKFKNLIYENIGVHREETIKRHIKMLENLEWIKYLPEEESFKILYYKGPEEIL